jgi:branched-chain amino acid transport system permease protein
MPLISEITQYAISGITSGSIYAIVGICWSIVFLVTRILNFTTGEFVMLGSMLTWVFLGLVPGLGLAPAIILAIVSTVCLGIIVERLAIRPVRYPSEITYMVITFAAASVIRGVVLLTLGTNPHTIKPFIASEPIRFLGASVTSQVIFVVGILVIITIGLSFFLDRTILGKALKATAINPDGARFVGIKISTLNIFCFGLAGGLGALAGIVIAPITFTGYGMGAMIGLKGLVASIAGGWSVTGTVIAGLGLGLAEGFFAGFVSSGWKDALTLIIMIVFLVARTISFSPRKQKV